MNIKSRWRCPLQPECNEHQPQVPTSWWDSVQRGLLSRILVRKGLGASHAHWQIALSKVTVAFPPEFLLTWWGQLWDGLLCDVRHEANNRENNKSSKYACGGVYTTDNNGVSGREEEWEETTCTSLPAAKNGVSRRPSSCRALERQRRWCVKCLAGREALLWWSQHVAKLHVASQGTSEIRHPRLTMTPSLTCKPSPLCQETEKKPNRPVDVVVESIVAP